ncbi:hypothetical protein [Shewanella sp. 30m-9]
MDSSKGTFDTVERNYVFHYDESNNVRSLLINDDNYNIDNDSNQKISMNFILAGIVHKPNGSEVDFTQLVRDLTLQDNIKEIKFKHIGKGTFEKVLKSEKITIFLNWILKSDCFIHYFNLNMEYWSFVDLIDDAFSYAVEKNPSSFDHSINARNYLDYYKDALYRLIKLEKNKFLNLVKRYGYPKIKSGFERKLISEINALLKENLRYSRFIHTGIDEQTKREFRDLSELFQMCRDIPKLELTYDLDEDLLLNGFETFYHNRGVSFGNSVHNFDIESVIEEKFEVLKRAGDNKLIQLNYSFVDSKGSLSIQFSDVIAGLCNKYFSYIESASLEEIKTIRNKLSNKQLENLNLFRDVINKSDEECQHFLFQVASLSEHEKHNMLLYEK